MPGRLENYKTANLAGAKRQCGSIGGNIVEDDLRVARVRESYKASSWGAITRTLKVL